MCSAKLRLIAMIVVGSLTLVATPTLDAADAKLTGKVLVAGKGVAAGKVTFHFDNGQFVGAKIKDGEYAIDRIPAGKCRVTVEGKGVPAAVGSVDTSPLLVEIKEGALQFDINLEAK